MTPDPRVDIPVRAALPRISRILPYARPKGLADAILHSRYLASFRDGDAAYLWTLVPLSVFEAICKRGNPIIVEAVNARMAVAKDILDRAYCEPDIAPAHSTTDDRIREQAACFVLCGGNFTPSPAAEAAIGGTSVEPLAIPFSYGTWLPPEKLTRNPDANKTPVTFVFLGSLCVQKGCVHLLEVWRRMRHTAVLPLVGNVEPALALAYADGFERESVVVSGFLRITGHRFKHRRRPDRGEYGGPRSFVSLDSYLKRPSANLPIGHY